MTDQVPEITVDDGEGTIYTPVPDTSGYLAPETPMVPPATKNVSPPLYVQVARAIGMEPIHPETPKVSTYDAAQAALVGTTETTEITETEADAEAPPAPPADPYAALDPTAPLGLRYTRRNLVVPDLPPRDLTVQEVCDLVRCQDDGGPIRGGLNGLLHPYSGAYAATPDTPTLPTWEALTQGQPQAG